MTKRFSDINRRSIIKGAAWAAPVVAATATIPAYAASKSVGYTPYVTQSQRIYTNYDRSTGEFTSVVTTAEAVNPERAGFLVGLTESNQKSAVTLTKLEYYIAVPKSIGEGYMYDHLREVSGSWRYEDSSSLGNNPSLSSLVLRNGSVQDVSDFYVFKFSYTGNTTGMAYSSNIADTWANTKFKYSFVSTDTSLAYSQTYYGGYKVSFILDATKKQYNDISLIVKQTTEPDPDSWRYIYDGVTAP